MILDLKFCFSLIDGFGVWRQIRIGFASFLLDERLFVIGSLIYDMGLVFFGWIWIGFMSVYFFPLLVVLVLEISFFINALFCCCCCCFMSLIWCKLYNDLWPSKHWLCVVYSFWGAYFFFFFLVILIWTIFWWWVSFFLFFLINFSIPSGRSVLGSFPK